MKLKNFIFLFLLIFFTGCIKPLIITPQTIIKEGVEVKISLLDSYEWRALSQDILVINLEIINWRNEPIWVFPLGKSVIIDSLNRQFYPVKEIVYQKVEPSPKFSLDITFSTQKPPEFTFNIIFGDETKEKEISKLIQKYELMKFKDGRIFEGASSSGIMIFYVPNYKAPLKLIIPNIYFEKSDRDINIEFTFE